jgi:hypothetical protein
MRKWMLAFVILGSVLGGCIGFVPVPVGPHHFHHHDWR